MKMDTETNKKNKNQRIMKQQQKRIQATIAMHSFISERMGGAQRPR